MTSTDVIQDDYQNQYAKVPQLAPIPTKAITWRELQEEHKRVMVEERLALIIKDEPVFEIKQRHSGRWSCHFLLQIKWSQMVSNTNKRYMYRKSSSVLTL